MDSAGNTYVSSGAAQWQTRVLRYFQQSPNVAVDLKCTVLADEQAILPRTLSPRGMCTGFHCDVDWPVTTSTSFFLCIMLRPNTDPVFQKRRRPRRGCATKACACLLWDQLCVG